MACLCASGDLEEICRLDATLLWVLCDKQVLRSCRLSLDQSDDEKLLVTT